MTNNTKKQHSLLYVGFILATVTFFSLLLVFSTKSFTDDKIANSKKSIVQSKFKKLLNNITYNNDVDHTCYLVNGLGNSPKKLYVAMNDNIPVAYIVNYDIIGGYSSPFTAIAGIDKATKAITNIDIIEFNETPGLGDKILRSQSNFLDSFINSSLSNKKFEIKKNGGDFDYFTGASVTPRAVVLSTKKMLEKVDTLDLSKYPKCK
ncbi:MAG: RnfABCDGE type electron transport complex subunit G [Succinivibrionaceae bacterium]